MNQRLVRVADDVDERLLGCRRACEQGRLGPEAYRRLTARFAAVLGELAEHFEHFGSVSHSLSDYLNGLTTRVRTVRIDDTTEVVVTAVLDNSSQVITVVSISRS